MTEHSEQIAELATALSAAQAEFTAIPKTEDNPFFKSKYADLAKVVAVASPILTKHGLALTQWIGFDDRGDVLTTVLLHKSGEFITDTQRLHLTKMEPQAQGSATTYARRYSYMAALGLVADKDDDGNRTQTKTAETKTAETKVVQPTAKPPEKTEALASAEQRGLINARASARGLTPAALANIVLVATGSEERDWRSEVAAQEWLRRAMDRLPASRVSNVLKGIGPLEQLTPAAAE